MNDAIQIWALYEQTAAQPPQYQPTANDKKASQLTAAAQKPQTPATPPTAPAAQEQQEQPNPDAVAAFNKYMAGGKAGAYNAGSTMDANKMKIIQDLQSQGKALNAQNIYGAMQNKPAATPATAPAATPATAPAAPGGRAFGASGVPGARAFGASGVPTRPAASAATPAATPVATQQAPAANQFRDATGKVDTAAVARSQGRVPSGATPASPALTVGQELEQSPVGTGADIAFSAADVPKQVKVASNLASRVMKPAAAVARPVATGLAGKALGAIGMAMEPAMMAVDYASDPQAFKQNLQSKNQRDIDLVDQGKYGQMAGQAAYDAAVSPIETIARSGMKAAETGRSVWDAAKSYFGNKGSALTPNAQQKAKAAGMLADNFNAALAFLQQQLNK